jgi:c-di-GMP-binding flagellar brake protein YcgR
MDNRRSETRKKVMAFTPVREREHGTLLGFLGNINHLGVMVVGEKALETETLATLEINLPNDLPGIEASQLIIKARVARCVRDEDSQKDYQIGFAFLDVEPEQKRIIEAILERYHFRHREWAKPN